MKASARKNPVHRKELRLAKQVKTTIHNDPSAGSPTETLLRLLLPLDDQVWATSRQVFTLLQSLGNPKTSLSHPIGSSDGRCVQRAGT